MHTLTPDRHRLLRDAVEEKPSEAAEIYHQDHVDALATARCRPARDKFQSPFFS